MPTMTSYRRLQQYALAISIASIIYNGAESGVPIGFGSKEDSRSLIFFGIQSGIEVVSAVIVVWRFRHVAKPGEEASATISNSDLRVEKIGTWGIGILLALLSFATEITAIVSLALHLEPDSSTASLIISAAALVIMILIWLPKRYLARALNSSTMAGEAACSLSCIQITFVLFVGSLVSRLWKGGWWVDSATSLILGLLFAREAYEMISWVLNPKFDGGCCSESHGPRLDRDAELGEQYRDLCDCCEEKEECKGADECKCDAPSDDTLSCCEPVNPAGEKCCTHDIVQGPKPSKPSKASPRSIESVRQDGHCAQPHPETQGDNCFGHGVKEAAAEGNASACQVCCGTKNKQQVSGGNLTRDPSKTSCCASGSV